MSTMNIWLVTNIRLEPDRPLKASAIQNFRTAAALADAGHRVLVWCDGLCPDGRAWIESQLGRTLPDSCRLFNAPARGKPGEKRSAVQSVWDRVWNIARARRESGEPSAIITRSPSIATLLRQSRMRPAGAHLILELQYPEWTFLWRGWARRNPAAGIGEAARYLKQVRGAEGRRYRAASGILYAARAHERLLDRAGYTGPKAWIPSGCEPAEMNGSAGPPDYEVGYVGSLAPENGLECLIDAVALTPGIRALIVGVGQSGYVRSLHDRAEDRGAARRIEFAGWKAPPEVRSWMQRCAVGVVSLSARCGPEKRQYASPLKLVEWMAAGVPVIASRVPSVMQHASEGDPVALYRPDSPQELSRRMHELLEDEHTRHRMAREGLERASLRSFERRAALITDFVSALGGKNGSLGT
jgi:glycosyltransferase involved in cell wall biosynthesis